MINPDNEFFTNNVPFGDVDAGDLWMTEKSSPDIFILYDYNRIRALAYGWAHLMTPIPKDQVSIILKSRGL